METRANFVAVGSFVLIFIVAMFAAIYWVAKVDENVNLFPLRVKIIGEVTGLAPGSAVHFNGIKVGKVEQLRFDPQDPRVVLAYVSVKGDTPIRTDTLAVIAPAGLTGGAYIAMKGGSFASANLLQLDEDGLAPLIHARPSGLTDVLETVRDVAAKAESTLASVESLVQENRQSINATVKNVEVFSSSLSKNAEGVDKLLSSASSLGDSINSLSSKLDGTIDGFEKLVKAVDVEKVKTTVDNIESFSTNLKNSGGQVETLMASVQKISTDLGNFSAKLDKSINKFDKILVAVEPEKVKTAINDIATAASGAKVIVADAQEITKTVTSRKKEIDQIILDASQMAKRLNASSVRVDGVLVKLEGLLGSDEAGGVIAEVQSTLAEYRKVAVNLNARINQVSGGITKFTNSGLKDIRAVVNDSRRTITRIDRVIGNLERDPSGFLFGKTGVKSYNGRPKR